MIRYVLRQLRASWGVALTLGVVAALTALVLSASPRAVALLHDAHVAWTVDATTPITRDLIAVTSGRTPGNWDTYLTGLADLRADRPEPLRDQLGEPDFQVTAKTLESVTPLPDSDLFSISLHLRATPHLADHAVLAEGRWPRATPTPWLLPDGSADERAGARPYEVAVSRQAAERFGWEAGGQYELRTSGSSLAPMSRRANNGWGPLVVVGIYEQDGDPQGSWWRQNPMGGAPNIVQNPNTGMLATAAAYVHPGMIEPLSDVSASTVTWLPLSGQGLRADDLPPVLAQLRGIDARQIIVDDGSGGLPLHFESQLSDTLTTLLSQRAGVDAIIAVLATGPLGAALAVLALAARLVTDRRRSALALLHARGASAAQLRVMAGAEGTVIGLAAATAGFAIGAWLVDGPITSGQVALAVAAGIAPGVALALAAGPRGTRGGRSDLSRGRGRVRWIGEVVVVVGAVVSTALLLQRGVVAGDTGSGGGAAGAEGAAGAGAGVDPLLAASPLLLALAVTVLVVRLFPHGAGPVQRLLSRRRDLVPFLGAARATRDPAGGVVPAVALVLCVSVAATAAVLYSTVSGGVTREAWREIGADLRISGPEVTDETARELSQIDGVAVVAPVTDHGRVVVDDAAGNGARAGFYTVEAAELARAQRQVADAPERTGALGSPGAGRAPVPVIVSESTGYEVGQGLELRLTDTPVSVTVSEVVEQIPGLPNGEQLILADHERMTATLDRAATENTEGTEPPRDAADTLPGGPARLALLALADDETWLSGKNDPAPAAVVDAIAEVSPHALVEDPAAQARQILASPASSGLVTAFVVAVALAALLAGAVLVMALMVAAPARTRLLTVLSTLGLSRRQARALVGWEIGPWLAMAVGSAALLGVVVPVVLLSAVDVTSLTGGAQQPVVTWDPVLLTTLAAGLVVVAIAAGLLAAALGRRSELATELRSER